ncbi:DNA-binding response regulator [Cohnella suwonensis]|uniref:DNA-binding response regulator n=1 Tax=Cohnella suwonensis TaxID=696072 RepID=A0ABW0M1M5_9BACL
MQFDDIHTSWLDQQRAERSGEALRKLNEDHAYAEELFARTVWLPAVGTFDHLHAEFEVPHARNSAYYLDFAYIRPPYLLDWEVDDFSPHAKNVTRRNFDYGLDRQNYLTFAGWQVYRLSLDAIRERPLQCQQLVLQVLGKLYGGTAAQEGIPSLTLKQREVLRLALRLQRPFTPQEVCAQLGIRGQHARALMHGMVSAGLLSAHSGAQRIRSYSLGPKAPKWI